MATNGYPLRNGSFDLKGNYVPDKKRAHCPRCGCELGGNVAVLCIACLDGLEIIRCARRAQPPRFAT